MNDPTRRELIAFLEARHREVSDEDTHTEAEAEHDAHDGCGCRFDIEEAAYYVAAHCHGGMRTNLYVALSRSPFRPGPIARDLPDYDQRPVASELYEAATAWILEGGAA